MLTNALLFFYVMFCHKVFTLDNIYLSTVFDMAVSAQCISQPSVFITPFLNSSFICFMKNMASFHPKANK